MLKKVFFISLLLFSFGAYSQILPDKIKNTIDTLDNKGKIEYLGNLCWNLREKSTDTSILLGNYAIKLADSLSYYKELAKISNYVGVAHMHYDYDIKAAIPYFHDALKYSLLEKDTIQIAYAYNNLGDAFYLYGNNSLALEYGEKSLHNFEKINNLAGIAYSYINLGLAYRAGEKYDLALHYFYEAIDLRKKINNEVGIASATYEVALTYFYKNDFKQALKYFNKSVKLHEAIDNKTYLALSLQGIGNILFIQGKYFKALEKYEKSLMLNELGDNKSGIIENKLGKALVYSKINKHKLGEKELDSALSMAKELGISSSILKAYKTIAHFYENTDELEKSVKSYNNYLHIYDSLFSVQQYETLSEMQNRFLMSQDLNKINQDLESKKTETMYLIIIMILIIGLLATLLWRYIVTTRLSRKLKLINDSKDKLFSIISHDLKAPFSSILGFSELLVKEAEKTDNKKVKKYSEYVSHMSQQSVGLINNLSKWSRSQRGVIKISKSKFNLTELFKEIIEIHASLAGQKDIEFIISTRDDFVLNADEDIIRTIITNLVSNAIKFSNERGRIEISAEEFNNVVRLKVKDSGVGIKKENIAKLFSVKDNYTTTGTNDEKGTGLGLIICKEFAEMHGGKIDVESIEGEGSIFIVTIPKSTN